MKTPHETLVQVFHDWERDVRLDPKSFMTKEEAAICEMGTLAEGRAVTFAAYLRQLGDTP